MAPEKKANPYPLPGMQVGPGLKIRLAMGMADEMTGEPATLTDENRQFLLSYHRQCVCNSNCEGRHDHRILF